MIAPVIPMAAALLLALVFMTAAASKAMAMLEFEGVVGNYRLLPRAAVPAVARLLPVAEAATALMLLAPATRAAGALAAAVLLSVFAGAMAVNIRRGRNEIDCGCFRTTHRQRLSWWLVARNGALTLAAAVAALPAGAAGLFDHVQALLAAGVFFLLYMAGSQLALPRPPSFDENYARSLAAQTQEV